MIKKILGITLLLTTLPQTAIARDQINIVGSSQFIHLLLW